MRKLFLSLMMFGCLMTVSAQDKFLDKLVKQTSGQGTVRVIQDAEITRLVNGGQDNTPLPVKRTDTPASGTDSTGTKNGAQASQNEDDETVSPVSKSTRKMKANGYRIQVYAGGNSRNARQEAQRMASKVKSYFSDMATYTHFQSPRWICRVGDFRTYEEASQALHEMRATKQFDEALIVKSLIQIPY